MVRSKMVYEGDKHCLAEHEPSGTQIGTDAPKDNQGRGERFSPTDLVGAALGTCVLTTMAIMAERENISIKGARAEVVKEMNANPRRIKRLEVQVYMPRGIAKADRPRLEAAAHACPVHHSLHPEVEAPISIHYED